MTAPQTHLTAARRATTALLAAALLGGAATAPAQAAGGLPGNTAAAGPTATKAESKPSKPSKQRRRADQRRKAKVQSGSVSQALSKVAYTGPTGPVVHSKSVTVPFPSDDPSATTGYTQLTERWAEIGGGDRERNVRASRDETTQQITGTIQDWRAPRLWAVFSDGGAASLAIFCKAVPADPAGPDAFIRQDRARLAELPAGPQINGVATRVGVHTMPVAGVTTQPEWVNYLDAVTGTPLRTTHRPADQSTLAFQTDYSFWELRPAGGSAADLSSPLPAGTTLAAGRSGCI